MCRLFFFFLSFWPFVLALGLEQVRDLAMEVFVVVVVRFVFLLKGFDSHRGSTPSRFPSRTVFEEGSVRKQSPTERSKPSLDVNFSRRFFGSCETLSLLLS